MNLVSAKPPKPVGGAGVKVPFTWKVTGWFMVGWSPELPVGEVRPLRYFGEDLVAYRDESGELHVLEGHCKHLGAHVGHGGTVVGDCVQCPFHGWRWGPDGTNRYIPYQPERPNRALRLRVFRCGKIWRYQRYVENPPLSKVDANGYMALRKWATRFYEVPPTEMSRPG
jgi:nitrite reductase/ring-hydroxylating ferredoxin subunit